MKKNILKGAVIALAALSMPASLMAKEVTGWGDFKLFLDPGHSGHENQGLWSYSEAEKVLDIAHTIREYLTTYTDMPESDAYSIKEVNVPKGFTATYKQNAYVFTVTNTSTLIQTGQLIWPIPVLALIGVLFIAVGSMLLQKKRKTNA